MRFRWLIWKVFGTPNITELQQHGDFDGLLKVYSETFVSGKETNYSSAISSLHNQCIAALCQFSDDQGISFILRHIEFAIDQSQPYYESAIKAVARIGSEAVARLARYGYLHFGSQLVASSVFSTRLVNSFVDICEQNPALISNIAQILDDRQGAATSREGAAINWTDLEQEFRAGGTTAGTASLNSIDLRAALAEALGRMKIQDTHTRVIVIQALIHALPAIYASRPDISIAAAKSLGKLTAIEAIIPLLQLYVGNKYSPTTAVVANAADDALHQIAGGQLFVLQRASIGNESAEWNFRQFQEAVAMSSRWSKV